MTCKYEIQEHVTVLLQRTTPRLIAAENTQQMSEGIKRLGGALYLPLFCPG